ncbi:hypothetical protein GVAV_000676 [Gurleya vavrai]
MHLPKIPLLYVVLNLTRKTLYIIIEQIVRPGTTLFTEGAPVYRNLSQIGNFYFRCNHSIGDWVNTETGPIANQVESFWQKLKNYNKLRF